MAVTHLGRVNPHVSSGAQSACVSGPGALTLGWRSTVSSCSSNPELCPCARTFLAQPGPLGAWIWTPEKPVTWGRTLCAVPGSKISTLLHVVILPPIASGNHSLLPLSLLRPLFPCLSGWCLDSSFLAQRGFWLNMVLGW